MERFGVNPLSVKFVIRILLLGFCYLVFLASVECLSSPVLPLPVSHQVEGDKLSIREGFLYQLSTPAFSDYAYKLRSVALPPGSSFQLKSGYIDYPDGTVITKTFFYYSHRDKPCYDPSGNLTAQFLDQRTDPTPTEKGVRPCVVETRTLTKSRGLWAPKVYLWSDNSNKAVEYPYGFDRSVILSNELKKGLSFSYHVPDTNECNQCHQGGLAQSEGVEPIGPTRIDRVDFKRSNFPPEFVKQVEPYQLHSRSMNIFVSDVEKEARDYLDINCAHCHNLNGIAGSSGLFLDRQQLAPVTLGVCKQPVAIGAKVSGLSYDIYPQKPGQSILLERMASLDANIKMPELSKSTIDPIGLKVISDWITSMPGGCSL